MPGNQNGRIRRRILPTDSGKSAFTGAGYDEAACTGGLDTLNPVGGTRCWLRAATALLLVFARARTCLALGAGSLMRWRAARLRGPAGLRRSRRRAARGLPGRVATLAGLLIHRRTVHLRAADVVVHRRARRLRRPVRLRAAGTVTHRRVRRLRWPVRLRAAGTVSHRWVLRLRRPVR